MFLLADILAFHGTAFSSRIIRFVTRGPSHVGIVMRSPAHGQVLFESTSLEAGPCLYAGEPVNGCQFHDPMQRIGQCVEAGGKVDIYRLMWTAKLSDEQKLKLNSLAHGYVQRHTHYNMRGALLSGTRLLKWTHWLPVNRHEVFCSQLLHQMLESIFLVSPDNSSRYSPGLLVRKLLEDETYYLRETITQDNYEDIASGEVLPWI